MSEKNCQLYKTQISQTLAGLDQTLETVIATDYSDIWAEMQAKEVSGVELCDYLTWAHYNAVPLVGDDARQAEYASLVSDTCPQSYYNPKT